MSGGPLAALALGGAALAATWAIRSASATGRLRRLFTGPSRTAGSVATGAYPAARAKPNGGPATAGGLGGVGPRTRLAAALIGLAFAVGIGGWPGLLGGPVLAFAAYVVLIRRPGPAALAADRKADVDLPFAADLLAAALRAGASPDLAARSVSGVLGGPLGERLARVDQALRLGAPAEEAWAYLGTGPGARRLCQAAVRSKHSGAELAGALHRLADDLRADWLTGAEAAARRAGVLIVLPLGLCFLPAFVLAGLVPVIVAVLGDVLSP